VDEIETISDSVVFVVPAVIVASAIKCTREIWIGLQPDPVYPSFPKKVYSPQSFVRYEWRFAYTIRLNDARYKPTRVDLAGPGFQEFVDQFRAALSRGDLVRGVEFPGRFEQRFGNYLLVWADGGQAGITIQARSATQTLEAVVSLEGAEGVLPHLEAVPARAAALVAKLRAISTFKALPDIGSYERFQEDLRPQVEGMRNENSSYVYLPQVRADGSKNPPAE
jgi:hypothetical protein